MRKGARRRARIKGARAKDAEPDGSYQMQGLGMCKEAARGAEPLAATCGEVGRDASAGPEAAAVHDPSLREGAPRAEGRTTGPDTGSMYMTPACAKKRREARWKQIEEQLQLHLRQTSQLTAKDKQIEMYRG
jgi:hypothetical protein